MPVEAFPCGSRSITRIRYPRSASAAPKLTAVVDLPTPPFWFAIATIRATPGCSGGVGVAFFEDGRRFEPDVEPPLVVERDEVVREAAVAPELVTAGS